MVNPDWIEAEFGTDSLRDAAVGNANVLAEHADDISLQNVVQCGLAAIAFALIYVGDEVRQLRFPNPPGGVD